MPSCNDRISPTKGFLETGPSFMSTPEIPAELFTFAMEMQRSADVASGATAVATNVEKRGARTYQGVLTNATQHIRIDRLARLWAASKVRYVRG